MNNKKNIILLTFVVFLWIIIVFIYNQNNEGQNDKSLDEKSKPVSSKLEDVINKYYTDDQNENILKMEEAEIIEDVIIEKNPVCSGEDFKVTVEASSVNGIETDLVYRVGTQKGNPAILGYEAPGVKNIHVFVRDKMKYIDHRVVTVDIRECPGKPSFKIKYSSNNSIPDEYDFEIIKMKGLNDKCNFEWDFGDGKKAKSRSGFASHNYGDRIQNSYTSTFIVTVKAYDNDVIAEGRVAVTLPNIQFLSSRIGKYNVPVVYNRFPIIKGDTFEVKVKFKNIFREAIQFKKAEVKFLPCFKKEENITMSYNANKYISETIIKPGDAIEDVLSFNRSDVPGSTCTMNIEFDGVLGNGKTAKSSIFLTIPMGRDEIQKGISEGKLKYVKDKSVIDKVEKAKALLNKQIITPGDINKLEIEGKL